MPTEEELQEILKRNPELSIDEAVSQRNQANPLSILAPLLEKQSEQLLLDWIIKEAHKTEWRVAHFRPGKTNKGWRTSVSADGKGFPDLLMVRKKRIIVAEVKSENGRILPEQYNWLEAFGKTKAEVYVWAPKDKPAIAEILR